MNFSGVTVEQTKVVADKGFTRLTFQLNGIATYPQLIRFLERFYAADHLHKITTLHMPVGSGPELLNVAVTIEALALRSSENKKELSKHPSADNPPDLLQAAVAQLMLRHFYRSNQPPQLTMGASVPATVGRAIRVDLKSNDPDGDKVAYQLVEGPAWLRLEGATLVATGNPTEGTYPVVVSVTDEGLPPKSASQKFTINVRPAPAPPKKVEHKVSSVRSSQIHLPDGADRARQQARGPHQGPHAGHRSYAEVGRGKGSGRDEDQGPGHGPEPADHRDRASRRRPPHRGAR